VPIWRPWLSSSGEDRYIDDASQDLIADPEAWQLAVRGCCPGYTVLRGGWNPLSQIGSSAGRPPQLLLLGLGGALFGVLEIGGGLLGLAWLDRETIEPELISQWFSMNLRVHLVLGIWVVLFGLGVLLMREWGRRGMMLHALLNGLWAIGFSLICATWVAATWEEGWEQADEGGAVNSLGVAASVIGVGALFWLVLCVAVLWILNQASTREAMNRFDRGFGGRPASSQ
jgi:hypothetical protein